jgi:hypothetical protein
MRPISSFPETRWTPRHRNRHSRLTRAAVGVLVACVVVGAVVLLTRHTAVTETRVGAQHVEYVVGW